jgi:hypothetical protein
MSAIFYADEAQKHAAEKAIAAEEAKKGRKVHTQLLELETFYAAEDYHQKYYLRSDRLLMRELHLSDAELMASPVAARLNGYVGGEGSRAQLDRELPSFNLSAEGADHLRGLVR